MPDISIKLIAYKNYPSICHLFERHKNNKRIISLIEKYINRCNCFYNQIDKLNITKELKIFIVESVKVRFKRDIQSVANEEMRNRINNYYQARFRASLKRAKTSRRTLNPILRKQYIEDFTFAQEGKCFYCQKEVTRKDRTLDHKIPISSLLGNDSRENLCMACKDCNDEKGNMHYLDFIELLKNKPNAHNEHS